ncbi:hypothetical protein OS493_019286 [Desmophyllum pertusum]|uniref:Uncharacterized protein n=1 Tax=Desmophyllum pertusum TaxID=174260 RepID=A0A9X0CEQ5_9CNID|nr:hypothetical protein OS493_019286 [Desmophyllum pertusum]
MSFARILHFSRFCGKQKNNQQGKNWLSVAVQLFEKNRNRHNHKPVQADAPQQARHIGFVA